MTRSLRRSLAASVAALSLLALTGCGGGDDDKASDGAKTSAESGSASPTTDAPSDTPTSAAASPTDEGGGEAGQEISAEEFAGIVKKALDEATTANVGITNAAAGGAGGLQGTGQIDYTGDSPSLKMTATIPQAGDLDMILIGKKLYLKGAMLGADKWVELPLDDPNSPFGALGDQLDPGAALEKLLKGIQKATYVGAEDVDGESLDHYSATVDTKVLLEDLPAETQGAVQFPPTVDYQMWFDDKGLIRKFSVDMGAGIGTSEGTFSDWGTKVDIAAPPASEITSMPGA